MSFPSNIIRLFFGYKKKDFYNNEKRENNYYKTKIQELVIL